MARNIGFNASKEKFFNPNRGYNSKTAPYTKPLPVVEVTEENEHRMIWIRDWHLEKAATVSTKEKNIIKRHEDVAANINAQLIQRGALPKIEVDYV